MGSPGFERLRARLNAQEQPLINRSEEEQRQLLADAPALRQQLEEAISQLGAMGSPELTRYPVPTAPSPVQMLISLLGAGIAGGLQGNRGPLAAREGNLDTIYQGQQQAGQANIGLSNQEAMQRHQMLVESQLRRTNILASRAEKIGDMETANKYGASALKLSDLRNKQFQMDLSQAEQEAATGRTEIEANSRMFSALLEKGMSADGLSEKDFAQFRADVLHKFTGKEGKIQGHNIASIMTSLVGVKKQGDNLTSWQQRIASDMQAFGLNTDAKKKVLALARGYAPLLFPDEVQTESPQTPTVPEGEGQGTVENPNALAEKAKNIVRELDALHGSPEPTGGLAADRKKERVKRIRVLVKELNTIRVQLRRQGYDVQMETPTIPETLVR